MQGERIAAYICVRSRLGRARRARTHGYERVLPEGKTRRARTGSVPSQQRKTHLSAASRDRAETSAHRQTARKHPDHGEPVVFVPGEAVPVWVELP
jgi:hypothetical protein